MPTLWASSRSFLLMGGTRSSPPVALICLWWPHCQLNLSIHNLEVLVSLWGFSFLCPPSCVLILNISTPNHLHEQPVHIYKHTHTPIYIYINTHTYI
jgi:hypothetical protein